jgi:hypothetical protein
MARLFAIGLSWPAVGFLAAPARAQAPAELRTQAHACYAWRDSIYPVATSDAGEHRWWPPVPPSPYRRSINANV